MFLNIVVTMTLLYLGTFMDGVDGQLGDSLQALLNRFCQQNPNRRGCHGLPPPAAVSGPDGCPVGNRRCPNGQCLPEGLSCDLIGSSESCALPLASSVTVQPIFCGTGNSGIRCDREGRVPVLTEIIVQCRGADGASTSVSSLSAHQVGGGGVGAGVYRCVQGGQWSPTYEGSPLLPTLLTSCYYAGCGELPSGSGGAAVNQTWPWLRHLLSSDNRVLCTATMVTSNTLVTAAHCVTSSATSRQAVNPSQRRVTLQNKQTLQTVQVSQIHVHPQYRPDDSRQNDLAVVKIRTLSGERFPHACLPPDTLANTDTGGVVFRLRNEVTPPGGWQVAQASYSPTCRSLQSSSCGVTPAPGQFCAQQAEMGMGPGSSGGPYLVNGAVGLPYVWMLRGVYSRQHVASSACNAQHVYTDTFVHKTWLLNCALYDNC
ncbi:chymotrypsin-like protease CTRL-1 isoform X2 [Hyalella azteca]|uniref:Chymotrypsin-like protease CTRL-1 isoform X2 n=1 Tax=Hyalella azteca TaxID=294128 RepID=A0A8B7PID2_HYAAZ|nr:chymotrypsin-like protease CTRL-1 isoform X2 [Hyalella azteca]